MKAVKPSGEIQTHAMRIRNNKPLQVSFIQIQDACEAGEYNTFSYPDYTVGSGVSPDPVDLWSTRGLGGHPLTADRELRYASNTHPAPKVFY
jgi:hypothetical protein